MVASSIATGQRALTTHLPAANEERRYVEDYEPRPAAIRQGLAVLKVTKVRAVCLRSCFVRIFLCEPQPYAGAMLLLLELRCARGSYSVLYSC